MRQFFEEWNPILNRQPTAGELENAKNAQKAISMFKDEYLLDFINVEELGERNPQDIDERVVENSI
ncbi:hypothetical protein SAMN05720468_10812 [Fibrobacter sp. UWEL]|nr:hypothetical protein [Fibrobacter sp. UWEL]SHK84738.1 hypothetical protein SAMN05720468_10812 [Fibrobacter sp. UWEL]